MNFFVSLNWNLHLQAKISLRSRGWSDLEELSPSDDSSIALFVYWLERWENRGGGAPSVEEQEYSLLRYRFNESQTDFE